MRKLEDTISLSISLYYDYIKNGWNRKEEHMCAKVVRYHDDGWLSNSNARARLQCLLEPSDGLVKTSLVPGLDFGHFQIWSHSKAVSCPCETTN